VVRVSWAIVAVALACAPAARAADPKDANLAEAELGTARALFQEGVAREDAKDWAGALERFKRVAEIRVNAAVLYNIALCYERLNKLASADAHYAKVIEKGGAPDLVKLATARRADLKNKIPEILLDGPSDLSVTLDGASATLGTGIAIDAGAHELVSHRGTDSAKKTFEVTTGKLTVAVPVPAEPVTAAPPPREDWNPPIAAYVGAGLVAVSVGTVVFGAVSRSSAINALDPVCGAARDHCPDNPPTHHNIDQAKTMSAVVDVGLGVAIVATVVTAGIIYFSFTGSKKAAPSAVGIPPLRTSIAF
jgi:hypothetical protein